MAKFSAKEFEEKLQKRADKIVRQKNVTVPIAKKVEETMYKVIKENVYDSYTPVNYERRGENGGLLDTDNIVATISGNHIIIENLAEPNESIFNTPFIEDPKGLLYQWSDEGQIGKPIIMPWSFNNGKWRVQRMGMTVKIVNNRELKDFIGDTIVNKMYVRW